MKRNNFVSLISGFVGFVFVLTFLSVANSASATGATRSAEAQPASPIVDASSGVPISTTFTYQGQLKNNGNAVSGLCNFQFGLWDSASGGTQVPGTITQTVSNVMVTNGLFSAPIDFGAGAFNGDARYLAIAVACPSGSGYTPMTQRQALTPAPYALYALNAGGGGSSWSLTGNAGTNPATNFLGTTGAQPLAVKTNNVEALRIDTNQNIGIGTNAPTAKLMVANGDIRTENVSFLSEGFESLAFPPAGWTTGGIVSWARNISTAVEGSASAAVTLTQPYVASFLNFTYTMPVSGQIIFSWKAAAYPNSTYLLFCLDNNNCTGASGFARRITGNVDWTEVVVPVSAGVHSFRWVLTTAGGWINAGGDKGWLDNVHFMNGTGNVLVGGNLIADALTGLGTANPTNRLSVVGDSDFSGMVGIGITQPVQLLHMNVITGQGEGMEIDSSIAGHAPAVYLNHKGNLGHNFRIASFGDNSTPGSFRIRDDTVGADRLVIDAAGRVGINTSVPSRTLEVNGVIGIYDGARTYYGGLASEVGGQLVDFGINDDVANRFGGAYNSAAQGGLFRVDTRGYDLFQFLGRPAGSTTLSQLASLNSAGRFAVTGGFNGTCRTDSNISGGPICNQDVAEAFATDQLTEPGDVMVLDVRDSATPTVRKATGDQNELLVGVVSTNPGLVFDNGQTHLSGDNSNLITANKTVVAALGRVPVKVSLENGPIAVGDPLTASSTPGVAVKATQAGRIIGYALQSSAEMKDGKLLMWLQIGAYLPPELLARVNEPSAPTAEIATLQSQVAALQQQNASLEARLTALEQRSQMDSTTVPASNLWSVAPLLIGVLVGLVVVRRPGRGSAR